MFLKSVLLTQLIQMVPCHIQSFWETTGTFLAGICGSVLLRQGIALVVKNISKMITGMQPPENLPGLQFGHYEFHTIKTGHLGLCAAAGGVFSSAVSTFV